MRWLVATVFLLMTVQPAISHVTHFRDWPAPYGHLDFCKRHAKECVPVRGSVDTVRGAVVASEERLQELTTINRTVNAAIQAVSDVANNGVKEYWTIDVTRGDCEEFVNEKRQRLIALGWPSSSLLVAAGIAPNGEGHAVLLVVMTNGVFVLDNLTSKIHSVHTTKVRLATAQKPEDPRKWAIVRVNENIQ